MMTVLKGWRYGLLVGGLVGMIALATYPIIIHPMMHEEQYRQLQEQSRAGFTKSQIEAMRNIKHSGIY
ncbi:hypothetical protein FQR65_LT18563 [Abscondita terminalis]|nr:hypothetical protein FQR65_LT04045 [Abscondita terminalis]KAF5306472.1 hypothetical protein FQR65_LT18563 [Abscondita terminalis]